MAGAALFFIATTTCLAQGEPRIVRWNPLAPGCWLLYRDGDAREEIYDRGRVIDVWAPQLRDKHVFKVEVGIQNLGGGVVEVDPGKMAGMTNEPTPRVMSSVDGDTKIRKENRTAHRWAILGAALSGAGAGMGNDGTATIQNPDGSSSTATLHDGTSVRQASQDASSNRVAIDANSSKEARWLLRRNSVLQNKFALGEVWIEKPPGMSNHSSMGEFIVDMGDTIYVFPFEGGQVPKALKQRP